MQLGAYYDPRLLHDYGGTIFNHTAVKLLQHDITDIDGSLVLPWEEYDKLRTGTVVLMKVTLRTFTVPVGIPLRERCDSFSLHVRVFNSLISQIYQVYAECVKILLPSDEPINSRSLPILVQTVLMIMTLMTMTII